MLGQGMLDVIEKKTDGNPDAAEIGIKS